MADIGALFDDFAIRRARGEHPDIVEFLRRAGEDADELSQLIEGLLMSVPTPEPSPATAAVARALLAEEPPIQALRAGQGRRRTDVIAHIGAALDIPERLFDRLRDRYHELEVGLLDPARVERVVIAAVADALGVSPSDLPQWRSPQSDAPIMARETPESQILALVDLGLQGIATDQPLDPKAEQLDRMFGIE